MRISILVGILGVLFSAPAEAQDCPVNRTMTPEQTALHRRAIVLARLLNTAQANQPGAQVGNYLTLRELQERLKGRSVFDQERFDLVSKEVLPGLELRLDVTERGYWFMVRSVRDSCMPAVVSGQAGVIYNAIPIQ